MGKVIRIDSELEKIIKKYGKFGDTPSSVIKELIRGRGKRR
jgi:hypothetical protein